MEREEIVKVLQCCNNGTEENTQCLACPLFAIGCIGLNGRAAAMLESDADEIAALKAENERIRQNYISPKVYRMACEERDAAVEDLKTAIFDDNTNSCTFCAHQNPKTEAPYCLANFCDNGEWEWRGLQKGKE